ncbi:GntR family transcriptional regulator [Rhodococcus sp. NCIMB 12038]|uniref:Naphthalene degradation GntR-like regulator protein n=1 Tax=Rhodococcus opacus TaxID=37919 RepID=Q0PEU0_RHOOP|nr:MULTISPECIES: GntR family transcriptional regulator [unclassified Rhodococcus (in: high G+C Gram-positive bacteria)]ABH01023.1 naphthalene degradation GntR-like regulator protein [Rhodococcus opacus]AAQ98842.1 putative naphthalene degradation regulator protein [Rhodococcus sp. NCIMB 12038]OUS86554.1 GntR family transcriptional regulator [Rhodococcus sp. NCIMB 12038]OZE92837.1 GntR family transcriptional regulator [Rhodococcus sp. 15-1189-1-1a]OZF08093.1 GntR family transcriptional regulator
MVSQRLNRSGQAYEQLTAEILRGRWQPGDTLSTYALSEELQISRTPISEALKRLESEGLVEIIPQVGCRVVRPSSTAVTELFAIRGVLEGLAAEAAAKAMSAKQLAELGGVLERMEVAIDRADEVAYGDLNYQFHLKIIEGSGMPRLIQTVEGLWSLLRYQLARLPFAGDQMGESMAKSRIEHRAIFEALERRGAKRARTLAEQHSRRCGDRFVVYLEGASTRGGEKP